MHTTVPPSPSPSPSAQDQAPSTGYACHLVGQACHPRRRGHLPHPLGVTIIAPRLPGQSLAIQVAPAHLPLWLHHTGLPWPTVREDSTTGREAVLESTGSWAGIRTRIWARIPVQPGQLEAELDGVVRRLLANAVQTADHPAEDDPDEQAADPTPGQDTPDPTPEVSPYRPPATNGRGPQHAATEVIPVVGVAEVSGEQRMLLDPPEPLPAPVNYFGPRGMGTPEPQPAAPTGHLTALADQLGVPDASGGEVR